jgi:AAA domain (dynein-related subfamily)
VLSAGKGENDAVDAPQTFRMGNSGVQQSRNISLGRSAKLMNDNRNKEFDRITDLGIARRACRAGKTELATSVSRAYGIPLLRLQCYQGINEEKAIGQYDKSLQDLYVLLMSKSDHTPDWAEIKREVTSRAYFIAGPLLEAIEQNQRCVLLIDEIDKVDYAFEAMLLELLSGWTLSIPKMGTVHATSIPYVFLTSNQERRLGDPLPLTPSACFVRVQQRCVRELLRQACEISNGKRAFVPE